MGTLQLAVQDSPLLGQLLLIGNMLQLATAAAQLEEGTGRIDPSGRGLEDGSRLRPPEILAAMRDLGFDRLAGNRSLDEDDASIDARHGNPAVGKLSDRQLH